MLYLIELYLICGIIWSILLIPAALVLKRMVKLHKGDRPIYGTFELKAAEALYQARIKRNGTEG